MTAAVNTVMPFAFDHLQPASSRGRLPAGQLRLDPAAQEMRLHRGRLGAKLPEDQWPLGGSPAVWTPRR